MRDAISHGAPTSPRPVRSRSPSKAGRRSSGSTGTTSSGSCFRSRRRSSSKPTTTMPQLASGYADRRLVPGHARRGVRRGPTRPLVVDRRYGGLAVDAGGSAAQPLREAARRWRNLPAVPRLRRSGRAACGFRTRSRARVPRRPRRRADPRQRVAVAGHVLQPGGARRPAAPELRAASRERTPGRFLSDHAMDQCARRLRPRHGSARPAAKRERHLRLGVVFARVQPLP